MEDRVKTPSAYAKISLITGDQRNGKSTIGVSFPIGAYIREMTELISPNGEPIKAKCLTEEDKNILKKSGIRPNWLKYCRVFSDDSKESKIIRIPTDYMINSPVHIFANFHLYGVKFSYISLADIIEHINDETLFRDAWILSDESGMTDSRSSMEATGKLGALFYATIGKRNANFIVMAQYNEMVERRLRLFATMKILCSYDKDSKYITCEVKRNGEPEFSTDVYAPNYWRFFDSEELIKTPQYKIDKALEKVYQS